MTEKDDDLKEMSQIGSARQAIDDGRYDDARRLLKAVVRADPRNYKAWLWLAGLSPSPIECVRYVEIAESIKPDDQSVKEARVWADKRLAKASYTRPTSPTTPSPASGSEKSPASSRSNGIHSGPKSTFNFLGRSRPIRQLLLGIAVLSLLIVAGLAASNLISDPLVASGQNAPANGSEKTESQRSITTSSSLDSGGNLTLSAVTDNPDQLDSYDSGTSSSFISDANVRAGSTPETGGGPSEDELAFTDEFSANSGEQPSTPLATPASENVGGEPFLVPSPTLAPLPTSTPIPTPTETLADAGVLTSEEAPRPPVEPGEKWIGVSLANQKLVAYEGDAPVFESLVSTGSAEYPTVTGDFEIWLRYESQDMNGYLLGYDYFLEGVPYVQYFYKDFAIHGTFWHSNFGVPMSHGCVNVSPDVAEWLYDWADYGTLVSIR